MIKEFQDRGFWFVGLSIFGLFFMLTMTKIFIEEKPLTIDPKSFPVLGNQEAPVDIVVFQEFSCPHCQAFHEEIFEWIQSSYISTGKAKCTVIPTALLESSKAGLSCALAALDQGPQQFGSFLSFFFHSTNGENLTKSPRELLSGFFHETSNFSLSRALRFIKNNSIENIRNDGIELIEKIYSNDILLPTLIINGKRVQKFDKTLIRNMIEREYAKTFHKHTTSCR